MFSQLSARNFENAVFAMPDGQNGWQQTLAESVTRCVAVVVSSDIKPKEKTGAGR